MDSLAAPTAPGHSLPKERRFRSTTSSSSSSRRIPSPSHGRGYEVFLSFRGPDTRKVFADFLYLSLKDAGVDAFRDSDELHVGEDIGPELLDRIERCIAQSPVRARASERNNSFSSLSPRLRAPSLRASNTSLILGRSWWTHGLLELCQLR
ncbi:hypothetical protein CRG98_040684 [Punica granatum]|uniref:ADP-ribosyl cyclase/cyclic ADP-ribose hydrolase n=1 Tax=Punica granatum TaxID=22663 RepID=A0A2I0I4L9_PUNGR|nr:hypothetical protein CRG98_040684 [Punica granatum]